MGEFRQRRLHGRTLPFASRPRNAKARGAAGLGSMVCLALLLAPMPAPCGAAAGTEPPAGALLFPKALPATGTIAIVAPASRVDRALVEKTQALLRAKGYRVRLGRALYGPGLDTLAGPDEERAADINEAIRDPGVDAILCARGGYGAPRILARIDYHALRRDPKPIVGFSDITALHQAVVRHAGVVSFHGPMLAGLTGGTGGSAYTREQFWRTITASAPADTLPLPAGVSLAAWSPGEATGELMGGNLTLLASLVGTPYAPERDGMVLLLEDVVKEAYRVDRALAQLAQGGILARASAVLVGEFIARESASDRKTMDEILKDYLLPLGVPVLANVPAGHGSHNATLPLGARVHVRTDPPGIEFTAERESKQQ